MQADKAADAGDHDEGNVKRDLHRAELQLRERLADGQHQALARERDDLRRHLDTHADRDEHDANKAENPLLPVGIARNLFRKPDAEIRQHAEHDRHRQLQELQ